MKFIDAESQIVIFWGITELFLCTCTMVVKTASFRYFSQKTCSHNCCTFFSSPTPLITQKKVNWGSKETYHFFRATFTEIHCIKMIQIWTLGKFVLNIKAHVKKQKFNSINEEINGMKSQEVIFQQSQKLLACRAGSSDETIARRVFT